jgi:gliding motility-associated-like protein
MNDTVVCLYQYKYLSLNVPMGFNGMKHIFKWDPGDDTLSVKIINKSGLYRVFLKTLWSSTFLDTIKISVNECRKSRYVHISKDTSICLYPYESILLDAFGKDSLKFYQWLPVTTNFYSHTKLITSIGEYKVVVKFKNIIDTIRVTVNNQCAPAPFYVPNSFSPNGDGKNDTWGPQGDVSLQSIYFEVHNENGLLVFSSTDKNIRWNGTFNGKPCPSGFYVFYVEYVDSNGKKGKLSGNLELVR